MWFNNGKESSLHLINLCWDSIVTLLTYVKTWILGNMTMVSSLQTVKSLILPGVLAYSARISGI